MLQRPTRRAAAALAAILLPLTAAAVVPAPTAAAPPAPTATSADRGAWQVSRVDAVTWRVAWTAPGRLPLGSDRPTLAGAGLGFGAPTVSADGRTVSATVRSAQRPDPADLDVLLSGDRLDESGLDAARATAPLAAGRAATAPYTQGFAELADDPGVAGPFATVASDYELDPVKLPGMPEPVEMVGHVVEPAADAATGPRPLVLFQHGRHGVCYDPDRPRAYSVDWPCAGRFEEIPSHLGYVQTQELLASQGYATVSIRVNGINAQDYRLDDGGADARAEIIARHLDHWVDLAPAHDVDLDRVVLVGHSRGGEGVDRASIQIPLSAPYRVAGQVLIAPTDFGTQTAPYVPTVTLLPACDGDVFDLQGQRFTDYGRDVAPDDTSLKSSVLVLGANHNFFNSEWTPGVAAAPSVDDWFGGENRSCGTADPRRLDGAEQRAVGATYTAGAVRLFTGDDAVLPLFDGSRVTAASAGDAEVLSHAVGGGRDVRAPGDEAGRSLPDGAASRFCRGTASYAQRAADCGRGITGQVTPHWTTSGERTPTHRFLEVSWDAPGQRAGLVLEEPLDLAGRRLELRTLVDPRLGDVQVDVRLTDADGATAVVTPEGDGVLRALPRGSTKIWGQTLLVDASEAAGIDPARVTAVDLVARSGDGRVWVADVSAAPDRVAAVPQRRMATISFADVRRPEGDGPAPATVDLPFTVTGLTRPARVLVLTTGQARGSLERYVLDLAPGQTSGVVPLTYQPDDERGARRYDFQLTAWALDGVMTDQYVARASVIDDDRRGRG